MKPRTDHPAYAQLPDVAIMESVSVRVLRSYLREQPEDRRRETLERARYHARPGSAMAKLLKVWEEEAR